MQNRYWIFQRSNQVYYLQDRVTGKQTSLRTTSRVEAERLFAARNQAVEQPAMNVCMAKAYLAGRSPQLGTRTWDAVMVALEKRGRESTQERCARAMKSEPFSLLRKIPLIETDSQLFLDVLHHKRAGTSTNAWLRALHNFALNLGWLLSPVMARNAWPTIVYKKVYAITAEDHARIIDGEANLERRLYYELLWLTGGSQSDIAELTWEAVDTRQGILTYRRKKRPLDSAPCHVKIGARVQALLDQLPSSGPFFPTLREILPQHRASEFKRRLRILGIEKKTLKSYRNAWIRRARLAGMPKREAMEWVGHKSHAVHDEYAKDAEVVCLPLEYYEAERERKIVAFKAEPSPQVGDNQERKAS